MPLYLVGDELNDIYFSAFNILSKFESVDVFFCILIVNLIFCIGQSVTTQ